MRSNNGPLRPTPGQFARCGAAAIQGFISNRLRRRLSVVWQPNNKAFFPLFLAVLSEIAGFRADHPDPKEDRGVLERRECSAIDAKPGIRMRSGRRLESRPAAHGICGTYTCPLSDCTISEFQSPPGRAWEPPLAACGPSPRPSRPGRVRRPCVAPRSGTDPETAAVPSHQNS